MTANELTKVVLKRLQILPNVTAWRNNNIAVRGRTFIGRKGVSDICGVLAPTGRALFIEIKAGNDKQSKHQKEFQHDVIQAGGIYFIVTNQQDIDLLIQFIK